MQEDIMGDLFEWFQERSLIHSQRRVWWAYLWHSLSLWRLFKIPTPSFTLHYLSMLRHYFKIAFRNLIGGTRNYTLINLGGLAFGLATSLLILAYIQYETGFDEFHEDRDRIYKVQTLFRTENGMERIGVSSSIVSPLFQREFPEVVNGVRLLNVSGFSPPVIRIGEDQFQEDAFYYADSTFFHIFSFPLLQGDPSTVLSDPSSLVINETLARKYFPEGNAIGQTVELGSRTRTISGVMADMPAQSQLQINVLGSFASLRAAKSESWFPANYHSYLLLNPGADIAGLRRKIPPLLDRELGEILQEDQEMNIALMPLTDVHLLSDARSEISATTNIRYLYIFGAIAVLVLLIACINYINLATARAIDRAREVGLRKVVGARQGEVFSQFMGEATFITILATLLGLGIVFVMLPMLGEITGRDLSLEQMMNPEFLLAAVGIMVAVIFLAGGYPALVLANLTPIKVLRGTFRNSKGGTWLRNGLVVFQFGVSTFLIVGTLVIYQQLQHVQKVRLGYEKEHLVSLPMDRTIINKLETIKSELTQHPQIVSASAASESPVRVRGGYTITNPALGPKEYNVQAVAVDKDFVQTIGLEIIAGNNYTATTVDEENVPFLLNETALKTIGLTIDDIGAKLDLNGRKGYLHGVIKDFHFSSLHEPIGPLTLFIESQYNELLVRLAAGPVPEALDALEDTWAAVAPHRPFTYTFLDDSYQQLYDTEQQAGSLLTAFSIVAIAIACLGLLGLAAFTAVRRSKEIGIRKVLGATEWQMVSMLSGDFTKWVGLAILISLPLSWYLMNDWLSQFAYRINVGWEILLGASLISLLIAWGTVGFQAYRTASLSPSLTLRDE